MFKKVKLALIILISFLILGCPNPASNSDPIDNSIDNPTVGSVLTKFGDVITGAPCYVNIMFQAKESDGTPISDLTTEDFSILEEGSAVSPTEAALRIRKQNEIPYTLYTVLMLDNSMSVGNNIIDIKAAAKELINTADNTDATSRDGSTGNQKFIIYNFYGTITEQTSGFTNDVATLIDAIDSIPMGGTSTNLYGAVELGVSKWTDVYSTEKIEQGFLVVLTDGSDEADISTLSNAKNARGDKKVITIGVGDELDTTVMEDLGNAGFYHITDYSELTSKFLEIQTSMQEFANSFYWLDYLSPKRGDKDRSLSLSIDSENYPESNELTGTFNTADFYDVLPGVYINVDSDNHSGITTFSVGKGDTYTLTLNTYFGSDTSPSYEIASDCGGTKVEITQSETNSNEFTVECLALDGTCILTINDTANNYTKDITCLIDPRFTITYDLNGAESGEVPVDAGVYESGETATALNYVSEPLKTNYIFKGWNTEPEGTGTTYSVGDSITLDTSNITLYVEFTRVGTIGEAGGYIFYDKGSYSDGWRYLEAAPEDILGTKVWGTFGSLVSGADGTAVGTGAQNTLDIIAGDASTTNAAHACTDYSVTVEATTYDDWFLPSKDELDLMYDNLKVNGLGGFVSDYYWSSSENDDNYAWLQSFNSGFQGNYFKSNYFYVRPVRAF